MLQSTGWRTVPQLLLQWLFYLKFSVSKLKFYLDNFLKSTYLKHEKSHVAKFKLYSNLKSILTFCSLCRKLNIVSVLFTIMMLLDISNKGTIYCIALCSFISSARVKETRWLVFTKNITKVIIYITSSVFCHWCKLHQRTIEYEQVFGRRRELG